MPVTTPLFPDRAALAKAFFSESLRHLEDARVLHKADRFAASIASSAKAAELAVKTVLILDAAVGWWNNTLSTHTPLTDIESHLILKRHFAQLQAFQRTLPADVKALESLAPSRSATKSGGPQFNQQEENPEYPFLYFWHDPTTGTDDVQLREPGTHFAQTESHRHYDTAREVVNAVIAGYADIQVWNMTVPASI